MSKRVLITGGAGFVGSHLADELLAAGYEVRALDNLSPQVHGFDSKRPEYLSPEVELQIGDVRNPDDVRKAIDGVDIVYHFAAAVGVGQSMYEIVGYTDVNNIGCATLLQELINHPVERLVVASSMSIYGEGLYTNGVSVLPGSQRKLKDLKEGLWELYDEQGTRLEPIPTTEEKQPDLASIYALSKYDQERMTLMIGNAYNIQAVALRFFNIFGTRQALSNPYTGVLAIFASRFLNGNAPLIFEDGQQLRDFVSVKDVARACRAAIEKPDLAGEVINVGSGRQYSVSRVAEMMAGALSCEKVQPQITGKYRVGDIRHCFSDLTKAEKLLDFKVEVPLEDGLVELAEWVALQDAMDRVDTASKELESRGLAI